MKLIIGATFYGVANFLFGFVFGVHSQQERESDIKTCQSEFNQQTKSTSIEHGRDTLHKGVRLNRIVIECEDNKQ